MTEPFDQQAALESALGQLVLSYGQLTSLLLLAASALVDPTDLAVGRLLLAKTSDAYLEESWFKLARHRAGHDATKKAAIEAVHRELAKLRQDRNHNVHSGYIAMFDGSDPTSVAEYRAAPRGRIVISTDGMSATPIQVEEIRELARRSEALRVKFLTQFVGYGGALGS